MPEQEIQVCARCGRKDIRWRITEGTYWCRLCGYDSRRNAEEGERNA